MQILRVRWIVHQKSQLFSIDSSMFPTEILLFYFSELRKLASVLVDGWMATIRSQSVSSSGNSPAGIDPFFKCLCVFFASFLQQFVTLCINLVDKKKRKVESKVPVRDVKEKSIEEEKKKEKPKAHAPSHTKIRSIGNFTLMSSDVVDP